MYQNSIAIMEAKKSSTEKENWLIRITDERLVDGFFDWLKSNGLKFLVKEIGSETEKPHFQGVWYGLKVTFQKWVKKYGYKGNESYSMKKVTDIEGCYNYLCKGSSADVGPDIRFNDGVNITGRHEQWWRINAEIKEASKTKKRQKVENILETCWSDMKLYDEGLDVLPSFSQVGSRIYRWYLDHGMRLPTKFVMDTMINTYIGRLNDLRQHDKLSDEEMYQRLYSNEYNRMR